MGARVVLSRRLRLSLNYVRFWKRTGNQQLEWVQYAGQPEIGTHMYYRFESSYEQQDLLVRLDYDFGWHGLYLMAGREISHGEQNWRRSWQPYYDGEPGATIVGEYDDRGTTMVPIYGLGRAQRLGRRIVANVEVAHSFHHWTSGTRVAVDFWYEL